MKSWLFLRPKIYPCISSASLFRRMCLDGSYVLFHSSGLSYLFHQSLQGVVWKRWGWGKGASFQLKVGTFLPDELRILGISWVQPTEQGKRGGAVWGKRTELSLGRGTSYSVNSRAKKKIWKKVGSRATSNCVRECKEVTQGRSLDSVLESCFLFS